MNFTEFARTYDLKLKAKVAKEQPEGNRTLYKCKFKSVAFNGPLKFTFDCQDFGRFSLSEILECLHSDLMSVDPDYAISADAVDFAEEFEMTDFRKATQIWGRLNDFLDHAQKVFGPFIYTKFINCTES